MKEIKIKTIVTNSEHETTFLETLAKCDKKAGLITYHEEDLEVSISIINNKVILNRKNDDYDLTLEFKEGETIECTHKILSIGLTLDVSVTTLKLDINDENIYINYQLKNIENDMGNFEYKLIFLE